MSITFSAEGMPKRPGDFGGLFDVNMANGNAVRVMETLGIGEVDWTDGELPAADFLGRVVLALALAPEDEGMPAYEHPRVERGALFMEGARRPGYLQQRLQELHTLAQWAVTHQTAVWWC